MSDTVATQAPATAPPGRQEVEKGYLYGPLIDFMCLGGGSLLILFPIAMAAPEEMRPYVVAFFVILAHFVNNPHFIHSYQIFYTDYFEKAFGESTPAILRLRYKIAGIVVPTVMTVFFLYSILTGDPWLLGLSVNAMAFLVGWHYAKQGYGILIVESVMKRAFFNDQEKAWFRYNAFAVWFLSWSLANIKISEGALHGLKYYSLALPSWLAYVMGAAVVVTSLRVIVMVASKGASNGYRLPWNGLLAYATSIYVWLIASGIDPLLILMVPAFHSLQYLAVVWRYQLNKERADTGPDESDISLLPGKIEIPRPFFKLLHFIVMGTIVGVFVFWLVPIMMSATIPYDQEIFGVALFVFIAVIFINIHHYFLDNVMWRKENPQIKQHLFTPH